MCTLARSLPAWIPESERARCELSAASAGAGSAGGILVVLDPIAPGRGAQPLGVEWNIVHRGGTDCRRRATHTYNECPHSLRQAGRQADRLLAPGMGAVVLIVS